MDMNAVGNWLLQGGRVRLLKPITTNGGVGFAAGEILRLAKLVPYTTASALFSAEFVSVEDARKVLNVTGCPSSDNFELVESK